MRRRRRAILALVLPAVLMLRAGAAREAAAQAVESCAMVVFPSLFPFCVACRYLTGSGALRFRRGDRWCCRMFGVPAAGLGALAMGLCGGYPMGVQAACELYRTGQLGREETERFLRFGNDTGPAIFFGMAGAMLFKNAAVCAALYGLHILSALLTGLVLAPTEAPMPEPRRSAPEPAPETLPECISKSFFAVAGLCGYVIFFAVALRLVQDLPLMRTLAAQMPVLSVLLAALTDLPSGISAMAGIGSPAARFILCSGAVTWGGLCVYMQARSLWQAAGLRVRGYLGAKLFQSLIAALLAFPAAWLLFGIRLPLWPAALPFAAIIFKKVIAFFAKMGYNEKKSRTEAQVCCFARSRNPAPTAPAQSK